MNTILKTQPVDHSFFTERENTLVTWLGMAGALINARGEIIMIDPLISTIEKDGQLLSEAGYRMKIPLPIEAKDVPRADWVMYTHGDDDHIGLQTAKILAEQTNCTFLATAPVARTLKDAGVPAERVRTIRSGPDPIPMGPVQTWITPALHDWQEVNPWKPEDCCGYYLKTGDGVIWHPGDTRWIEALTEFRGVDVLFFDVAAVDSHLGPEGSAHLAKTSDARVLIAYHYGTFDMEPGSFGNCDPDDALPYLKEVQARYLKLNPGEVFKLPF